MNDLKKSLEDIKFNFDEIFLEDYEYYINNISSKGMAVSKNVITLFCKMCILKKPKNILDMGSGFSSFVIRKLNEINKLDSYIITVDDNYEWLEKTRNYLNQKNVENHKLFSLKEMLNKLDKYDAIFYDLGRMNTRKKYFKTFLNYKNLSGFMLLDDLHKQEYKNYVDNIISTNSLNFISFKNETLDEFNRYAGIII